MVPLKILATRYVNPLSLILYKKYKIKPTHKKPKRMKKTIRISKSIDCVAGTDVAVVSVMIGDGFVFPSVSRVVIAFKLIVLVDV